jgi:hypothetical protein
MWQRILIGVVVNVVAMLVVEVLLGRREAPVRPQGDGEGE